MFLESTVSGCLKWLFEKYERKKISCSIFKRCFASEETYYFAQADGFYVIQKTLRLYVVMVFKL